MPVIENLNPLLIIATITGLLSIYYFLSLMSRIKKLKVLGALKRLAALVFFSVLTASISLLVIGTQGYQALTKEEPVATIVVSPTDFQNFHARMTFPDGTHQSFILKGDELFVDAYVLKWKPWTNILGLHTAYRLERISGRYTDLNDEKTKPRTIFAINNRAGKGLSQWREEHDTLSVLVDVEHGSASFVSADAERQYQLVVTTSGLLIRPLNTSESEG